MYISLTTRHLAWCSALLATFATADTLQDALSFGHKKPISPNLRAIPNWHIQSDGPNPAQVLSDRIILTPPYPGTVRSAIWAEEKLQHPEWTAEFEFRATGPERGGGNLQLWYIKDGKAAVGTSSLYTARNFDGLVLVVDTYGGRGGSIRAFLNDGSVDYKGHHNLDSLAFANCDYPYRNLGRPSKLQIKQTATSFEVHVDDRSCFKSDKVKLPTDYYFGISAGSAETPDSFEASRFTVHTSTSTSPPPPRQEGNPQSGQPIQGQASDTEVADLKNRLAGMTQHLETLEKLVRDTDANAHNRHQDLSNKQPGADKLNALDSRLQTIEHMVRKIQSDVEGRDYRGQLDKLQNILETSHSNLMTHLPASMSNIVTTSAPRMWTFVLCVVVVQLALAVSYVVYKRRRANAPKKYL